MKSLAQLVYCAALIRKLPLFFGSNTYFKQRKSNIIFLTLGSNKFEETTIFIKRKACYFGFNLTPYLNPISLWTWLYLFLNFPILPFSLWFFYWPVVIILLIEGCNSLRLFFRYDLRCRLMVFPTSNFGKTLTWQQQEATRVDFPNNNRNCINFYCNWPFNHSTGLIGMDSSCRWLS